MNARKPAKAHGDRRGIVLDFPTTTCAYCGTRAQLYQFDACKPCLDKAFKRQALLSAETKPRNRSQVVSLTRYRIEKLSPIAARISLRRVGRRVCFATSFKNGDAFASAALHQRSVIDPRLFRDQEATACLANALFAPDASPANA